MCDEIDLDKAAKHAGYSLWEFQRLFSFLTNTTVGAYIRQRKLSLAANDILTSNEKIIEIITSTLIQSRFKHLLADCWKTMVISRLLGIFPNSKSLVFS